MTGKQRKKLTWVLHRTQSPLASPSKNIVEFHLDDHSPRRSFKSLTATSSTRVHQEFEHWLGIRRGFIKRPLWNWTHKIASNQRISDNSTYPRNLTAAGKSIRQKNEWDYSWCRWVTERFNVLLARIPSYSSRRGIKSKTNHSRLVLHLQLPISPSWVNNSTHQKSCLPYQRKDCSTYHQST